jgi:tetrahydromethanopterin S-methyltransferase subunit E
MVIIEMVYCPKCGTQNEDDAKFCKKCGADLYAGETVTKRTEAYAGPSRRHLDEECFGLPYGGAIVGVIIGLVIILAGVGMIIGYNVWNYFWAMIIIIIGVLIIAGAIFGRRRYRQ